MEMDVNILYFFKGRAQKDTQIKYFPSIIPRIQRKMLDNFMIKLINNDSLNHINNM